ncbi:hypothetical protein ACP70R_013159 [Stipagrostis hirtigluma subsp. patula]
MVRQLAKVSSLFTWVGAHVLKVGSSRVRPRMYTRSFSTVKFSCLSSPSMRVVEIERKLVGQGSKGKEELADPQGFVNLNKLFMEHRNLCFLNLNSIMKNNWFAPFAQELFKDLLMMGFLKSLECRHMEFEPSEIFVKFHSKKILEVLVPLDQIREGDCGFEDPVVGPFSVLLVKLCQAGSVRIYKEVADLLRLSNGPRWWDGINDVLNSPIFWSPEDKVAGLVAAQILISDGSTEIKHGLDQFNHLRISRKCSWSDFRAALANNNFFEKDLEINDDYTVNLNDAKDKRKWADFFVGGNLLSPNYRLNKHNRGIGFGKFGDERHHERITFGRGVVLHLGDDNYVLYRRKFKVHRVDVAAIELDSELSLSLSIFHALRELKVGLVPVQVVL